VYLEAPYAFNDILITYKKNLKKKKKTAFKLAKKKQASSLSMLCFSFDLSLNKKAPSCSNVIWKECDNQPKRTQEETTARNVNGQGIWGNWVDACEPFSL